MKIQKLFTLTTWKHTCHFSVPLIPPPSWTKRNLKKKTSPGVLKRRTFNVAPKRGWCLLIGVIKRDLWRLNFVFVFAGWTGRKEKAPGVHKESWSLQTVSTCRFVSVQLWRRKHVRSRRSSCVLVSWRPGRMLSRLGVQIRKHWRAGFFPYFEVAHRKRWREIQNINRQIHKKGFLLHSLEVVFNLGE